MQEYLGGSACTIDILTSSTGLEKERWALYITPCPIGCANLQAVFQSVRKHSWLFSLHFNKVQHCTILNIRKFHYTGLSFLSLSAKCRAKIVFVLNTGEQ